MAIEITRGYSFGATETVTNSKLHQLVESAVISVGAKGTFLAGDSSGALTELAVGANDQVLTADSAQALGVKWATPASAATQAELEAASITTAYSSPGRQHYHPSAAKAWVSFNGTGTVAIRASYNVSSITDNGTGDYTINFTTAFSSSNYAKGGSVRQDDSQPQTNKMHAVSYEDTPSASSYRLLAVDVAGNVQDSSEVTQVFFGDL